MRQTICILGDVMLDTYVHCEPNRVSSEAPVVIAREVRRTYAPGGAGNVATNISQGFGLPVKLLGVVGDDSGRAKLLPSLIKHGVSPEHILVCPSWQTIEKTRFVDGLNRQMLRVDTENTVKRLHPQVISMLRDRIIDLAEQSDTLVISDYAKGTCSPEVVSHAIDKFRERGKFIVVNGKPENFMSYAGASVLILNLKEAIEANQLFGHDPCKGTDYISLARMLYNILWWEMRHGLYPKTEILITMGEQGMVWWGECQFLAVKAVPVDVANVTGAGDGVTATVAAYRAINREVLEESARNAGAIVGQQGSALTVV